jgi:hypothetical protein
VRTYVRHEARGPFGRIVETRDLSRDAKEKK